MLYFDHEKNRIEGIITTGYRDLFEHARGGDHRKVEPKFPAAALLDAFGRKVEPEVLFSPDDPDLNNHKDRLGCPCCDAKLRWTPPKDKVVGSRPRKGFFSSKDLGDHGKSCDLASSDDKIRTQTRNRLEFFSQSGPKLLYWNIPYKHDKPRFEGEPSPLKEITNVIQTGLEDGDAHVTYQIDSMDEFLKLAEHKPFDDPFWSEVVIYDEEYRIAWNDFVFGADQESFLKTTFDQANKGAEQPKVIAVNIGSIDDKEIYVGSYRPGVRVAFDQDRHLFTIECEPFELEERVKDHSFRSQIILQTHDSDVFNALRDAASSGEINVLHGIARNSPQEIQNVKSRWPEAEAPNNMLRSFLYLSTVKDVALLNKDQKQTRTAVMISRPDLDEI